ncbi:MAG: hypothetical protein H0V81_07585 [Solirubrobacterales bacterium]|nr:hypothetical protein [Solirubrobacterales bacterium]
MRASVGVDAARRCAERAGPRTREQIAALAERTAELVEAAVRTDGTAAAGTGAADAALELDAAYAQLWGCIVLGAENIAYRLALTSLVQALDAHREVAELTRARDADGVRELGAAVLAGEAEAAGAVARRLLEPDARAFAG